MTIDVSRLGIVVESTGINEARKALDGGNGRGGLVGAADKAERSVGKLTDTVERLMKINAGGFASAWNTSMMQLVGTLGALNRSVAAAISNLNSLTPAMNNATVATTRAANASERKAYHGGVVVNTLKAMTTAATAYAAINLGISIVKQADSWQMLNARLANATGSQNNANVAQQQMLDLSQRLRVPLEDSVKLYTRMAPAVQRMGKESGYAKDMVEGIATALQLGGANGAEASSVMLQLSQSFSSGILNGAEFNAVAENGSVLMRALEKSTGKSTAELKKLGSEGKLSVKDLGKAIQENLPMWREQFDKLPLTFEGAMQRLKNAWTAAVGRMGQDTKFNQELSKALRVVEEMIPAVAQGLGNAFIGVMAWVSQNKQFLSEIWDQLVGIGKDIWNVAQGLSSWAGEILAAGDSFSVVGFAIFSARLLLAGFLDGLTLIKGTAAAVGALIYSAIFNPLVMIVTQPLKLLLDGFSAIVGGMASVASSLGMDGLAESLGAAQKTSDGWAQSLEGVATASLSIRESLMQVSKDFFGSLADGKGAVASLLNSGPATPVGVRRTGGVMDEKAWGANPNPSKPIDKNAVAAANAMEKKFSDAWTDLNAKLEEQLVLRKRMEEFGLGYDKIAPAQKKVIELQEQLNTLIDRGASNSELVNTMTLLARAREVEALELGNEKMQTRLKLEQAVMDKQTSTVASLAEEATSLENQVATYGMAKGAVEALAMAEAKRRLADLEGTSDGQRTPDMERRIALLAQEVVEREKIAAATAKLGSYKAAEEFDKLFDAKKAEKFGDVLADGFGKAGKALGLLMNSFDKYEARQSKITAGRKKLEVMDKSSAEYARQSVRLAEEEAQARVASYADMAGAAKGFFEEGSKGYKAMEAAEKTFRLFQMAMNMKSFLQEIGLLQASTAAQIAANGAKTASDVAASTASASASMVEGTANAAAAVAGQGKGDPYTAFARMAAMAAVMAAIGFSVGGAGGGVDIAKQRQESQGTGTVMGDAAAKSESISKSLALLSNNSDIALRYSSGMLSSLQNIEYSLTGATSGVIRSSSVTGKGFSGENSGMSTLQSLGLFGVGGPIASLLDNVTGGALSSLLGIGSKTTLKDSGLQGSSQSVQNILSSGFNVKGYQDINKKDSAFGITYSNSNSTNYSSVDSSITREFGNVVSGMVDSLVSAATVLGYSGEEVKKKLEAANIDIGKISLKGLTGEEIQKQLEAVFSAIGDNLTSIALPSVEKFQKSGEGLLETAVRVASGVESAGYELEKLGLTAINVSAIINTSGDVASEIVRQSIMLKEAGTGVGEIVNTLTGSAGDIADTYKSLTGVRTSLVALGIADDVTRDLIRAAGGLEALQSALDAYTSNYFTDAEQSAMQVANLRKEFDSLGVAMPTSKAAFRALVESLSAAGVGGQETAAKVLLLAESFSSANEAYDSSVSAARSALAEAYDAESESLTTVKTKFEDFASTLNEFRDSLLTGDLSTLDVASKYALEKAKFEETLVKAKAGDETAIGNFANVANSFLTASQGMNASSAAYTADFNKVLAETEALSAFTSGKASVAELQLEALDKQVAGLMEVNTSVLTVAQAIDELMVLLSGGFSSGTATIMPVVNGSHADGLGNVPFDGYIAQLHKGEAVLTASENRAYQSGSTGDSSALVEELKALRAEVQMLRDGQREQTGAIISANFEALGLNADTIVEGQKEAARSGSYNERLKGRLE